MGEIDDFYRDLFQEINGKAEVEGRLKAEVFFDLVTDRLCDAGEFEEAQQAHFERLQEGIRIDGYCGDPKEQFSQRGLKGMTLGLIILDVVQDPELITLTNTEMQVIFRRAEKFLRKALDPTFRNSLEPVDPGFGLADLISTRWSEISRVKIFLITNKKLSTRVDGKESGAIDGREIVYSVCDITRYRDLVVSGEERERLQIDFSKLPGGPLRALLASNPDDERQVFLAAVPGLALAHIYDRWGARLLEQNVRLFLQARSGVNKGIKRTLENEPDLFFSFNNGITATAEAVSTEVRDGSLVITKIDNLQIVNGGQTTASIYAAFKAKTELQGVFVQMKLSVVSAEAAEKLVPLISKYANSQNKVSSADFFANHPFHVRMADFSKRLAPPMRAGSFDRAKWFYERTRGAYLDAQAHCTAAEKRLFVREYPKHQTFTKTDLAKYLMVWTDRAYVVNRGAQKNFIEFAHEIAEAWEKDDKEFSEVYFKYLIAKKIIFDIAGQVVQSRAWYEAGGDRSQHVVLSVAALANAARAAGKTVNFLDIWEMQDVTPAFRRALGQAADIAHEVLLNPADGYRNITEWAKQERCWAEIKKRKIDWDEEWLAELISSESERDIRRDGAKRQREDNGINAQKKVVEAGAEFWKRLLHWCVTEHEASEKERTLLKRAASIPTHVPSDKESVVLLKMLQRLGTNGCPYRL